MERHGLEQARAVGAASSDAHDVRLPERLRQPGSRLLGRAFVRSKVSPQATAVPAPKDFQMKATLDEAGYQRMYQLAVEYGLLTRGTEGDCSPGSSMHCSFICML